MSTQPALRSSSRRHDPFASRPLRPVPPCGPVPARVYFIGEKVGREEAKRGVPFVGISGKYLDLCLAAANIERSACRINNLVSTFTEYSKPTAAEIARDHDALVADIVATAPEVIVLIGAWSTEHVLYRKPELDKCHGVPVVATELFGGELRGHWVVLPVIHPASAVYSPDSLSLVLSDILCLGAFLDGEIGPASDAFSETDYRVLTVDTVDDILAPDGRSKTIY